MKKRAVIRIEAGNRKKNYTKAMEIAVRAPGVETVSVQGDEKNQLTVIGDTIDAVALTSLLRKKLGFAELISLIPYNNNNNYGMMENWEEDLTACRPTIQPYAFPQQSSYYAPPYYIHHDVGMNHHDSCVIL